MGQPPTKNPTPKAPQKGSFPIDHFGLTLVFNSPDFRALQSYSYCASTCSTNTASSVSTVIHIMSFFVIDRQIGEIAFCTFRNAVSSMMAGECKATMQAFMKCLSDNNLNGRVCREQSKLYLKCRMEKFVVD